MACLAVHPLHGVPPEASTSTTGTAPGSPSTRSAVPGCGASHRRSMSGSFTVADSPVRRSRGANCCNRASPRFNRSPRLDPCKAWISSNTTVDRSENQSRAPSHAQNSASCSGVVNRMSGGLTFCRCRLETGVSPVRVSTRTFNPISATGVFRFRSTSTASAFNGEM